MNLTLNKLITDHICAGKRWHKNMVNRARWVVG